MEMESADYIYRYWGKAQPRAGSGQEWHPLAYHGLDVAASGAALIETRPQLLQALANASGLPTETARQWLLFALSLHDIGKFADCFQCKVPELWHHKGVLLGGPVADPGHGSTGATLWKNGCKDIESRQHPYLHLFVQNDAVIGRDMAKRFDTWFWAVCGHHGRPVAPCDLSNRICNPALEDARAYIQACAELFNPRVPSGLAPPHETRATISSWIIAGLAMLADWIGSNQEWFAYREPTMSLDEYWKYAQIRAHDALTKSGLSSARVAESYGLAEALPGLPAPTPLQNWAGSEAKVRGQSLIVIEDLTGAGKTEAALILAHRLMQAGAAEGLYWALPTMATSDALYLRLAVSYGRLFANPAETSLVLAHSSREFNEIFKKSIDLGSDKEDSKYAEIERGDDAEEIPATAACARWIADDRRKTFLADVGVGTIDQALLGILPSKHQAMRLAALSRRVLVIDEIHSIDAYQNALVEALLEFHAAFGGSAILISATLTLGARQRLAKAFARGAGWAAPILKEPHFPLATLADASSTTERKLDSGRGTRRDLPMKRLDNEAAALGVLAEAAREGRAAVWVRNTVQDAFDAYTNLQQLLPDAEVELFHARFALGDRLDIQGRVLASFGKASEGDARKRILVATQVVEQSIDADWDVMISDLAPVDLLIQRAGRLHRHDRGARPAPVLHIVGPEPTPCAGPKWYANTFPRGQYVYPDHGKLWLTMKSLLDAGGLNLASANPRDLIERVYDGEGDIPEGLQSVSGRAQGAATGERAVGRMNALELLKGYKHHAGAWDSDTRTPTRLGEPTRTLRLAKWDGRVLVPWYRIDAGDIRRAWRLSEVSVLARRVEDIAPPDAALKRAMAAEVATWPERYDPPLLVPLREKDGEWVADAKDSRDQPILLRYDSRRGLRFALP